jgi:GTP-binding protein
MKFIDEAKIEVCSGKGGDGCVSFRRERCVEFGGPDGGNGGNGGDIIFIGDRNLNTLIDYKYKQHFKAKNGQPGMGKNRTGKSADDIYIPVPLGTEIIDAETEDVLIDIIKDKTEYLALKGGHGGRGNASFVSSVNRAPRQSTPGGPKQEMIIKLELKMLADIGLLGLPNAGKSTFISSVSAAKPKIADYPFTTLKPQLGMVRHFDTDMLMADLPGLVAGAHAGKGLGQQFLKHVSRCSALLHLIDGTEESPEVSYETIRNELEQYDKEFDTKLAELPECIALTKADATSEDEISDKAKAFNKATGKEVYIISSVAKVALQPVLDTLSAFVKNKRAQEISSDEQLQEEAL